MISKTDLRKEILNKRKALNHQLKSSLICENIKKEKAYKNAKNIFAYYPKTYEIDITSLFKDESKNWFLPKVENENLIFIRYSYGDKLEEGYFKVMVPKGDKINLIPDLIIVPAVAVDKRNYRLGYGKGYYDRFLAIDMFCGVQTLTPIFKELIVDEIPIENHDKKIDIIVTS